MIELGVRIFVLVVLLRLSYRVSSGLSFWQRGLIFAAFCIMLRLPSYPQLFTSWGEHYAAPLALWMGNFLLTLLLPCLYFWGVDKIPGRLNLPFQILGGLFLVLVF